MWFSAIEDYNKYIDKFQANIEKQLDLLQEH
jgi:hypothetical protein